MDHLTHVPLTESELTPAVVEGATVYGPSDETIGLIEHLHGAGPEAQAIVEVGGFLGLGAKSVAIPLRSLNVMRNEEGIVHATTEWTKEDLKQLPEHQHV